MIFVDIHLEKDPPLLIMNMEISQQANFKLALTNIPIRNFTGTNLSFEVER